MTVYAWGGSHLGRWTHLSQVCLAGPRPALVHRDGREGLVLRSGHLVAQAEVPRRRVPSGVGMGSREGAGAQLSPGEGVPSAAGGQRVMVSNPWGA